MKMLFAAALLAAASTAQAAELPVRPPQPGGIFPKSMAGEPRNAPDRRTPDQGHCPAGQAEFWVNRHDQGEIYFAGSGAVWLKNGIESHYTTGGAGTGIPIRIAVDDDPDTMPLPYFFPRSTWLLGSGEHDDAEILIWNDYVFYPECRLVPQTAIE